MCRSSNTQPAFRHLGWFPGRKVDITHWHAELAIDEGFDFHNEAKRFLREFGGITVEVGGPGVRTARTSFDLDPDLCSGQQRWFAELSERHGAWLFPLGEIQGGHATLAIDEHGGVHILFDRHVSFVGRRGDALGNLIDGDY
ncbi:SUKH-3 domain-containing protein [Nonomuraea fuscirosea]|uniref:SUKH-3 domain-containing protein n=1 Tax=Nonomuraea fuscirosea TaxID=1291556 RepID=UPI0033F40F8B